MNKVKFIFCFLPLILFLSCSKEENVWISAWKHGNSFGVARAGAALVEYNGFVYLIGGVDGQNFLDTVVYAKIQSDGSLSQWKNGPNLNATRGFTSAVVFKNSVYVVGGGNGPYGENLLRSVEKAKIEKDGRLSNWSIEKNQMVMPRRCSKVVVIEDQMYSFGGFGGSLLDSVERTKIANDGKLGEWSLESASLTIPRYVNGLKKAQNSVYIVGGHDQNKGVGIKGVEWSSINATGHFEPWKNTAALNTGRYGLSVTTNGSYLYALGGLTGAEYLDSVEMVKLDRISGLKEWKFTTTMNRPRSNFNSLVVRDWIYIFGGTNREGYLNTVEYAKINDQGEIGFWGTVNEKNEAAMEKSAAKQKQENLPNQGVVAAIKQTSSYTYAQVYNGSEYTWVAGPKTDLKLNQKVRYSKGVLMTNFFSKELQLAFPHIVFVGTLQAQ